MSKATSTAELSRLERLAERLLSPGGREQILAEREAEAAAARHTEVRAEIAAIDPRRAAAVEGWLDEIGRARGALEELIAAIARLRGFVVADDDAYLEQDRIRTRAGASDIVLDARGLVAPTDLSYLRGALAEDERQGRAAIAGRSQGR